MVNKWFITKTFVQIMTAGASSVKELSSNQEGDDEKRRKSPQVCPFLKKKLSL